MLEPRKSWQAVDLMSIVDAALAQCCVSPTSVVQKVSRPEATYIFFKLILIHLDVYTLV